MIAQVAFDLPLAEPFDYIIPPSLENRVSAGMRVEVLLGSRKRIGLVTGLLNHSSVDQLKSLRITLDKTPLLDAAQMALGYQLSAYYGCSLGEALFTIVRGCEKDQVGPPVLKKSSSVLNLYFVPSGQYEAVLASLIKPWAEKKQRVLVLVADQYIASSVEGLLKKYFTSWDYVIGTRSSVFRSLSDIGLVMMVDEDNPSFKQEQTPMYETRDVLLMRAKIEAIEVAFVSTTPTVEMMHLVDQKQVKLKEHPLKDTVKLQMVDLNNYKIMLRGILSPALLSPLESNLAQKRKTILVFNHRGSYAMTRCACGFVLKCQRCESPMLHSKVKKQYLCRHCNFQLSSDILCPSCHKKPVKGKSSWQSFGFGIEQLQKALQDKYPTARIETFERGAQEVLKDWDILIGTVALLRFKNQLKAELVAFLDIDSELNRMDMRSCFRAFSMVQHLRVMAQKQVLIQSRQMDHYVIRSLREDNRAIFYQEDMKIRRELGFSPFAHQVGIYFRGADPTEVEKAAQGVYQKLAQNKSSDEQIHAPSTEGVVNKRGQYRLNILLQGADVVAMIAFIKQVLKSIKRQAKVIITFNVDP
ncbi:MAG: hypothetical protein HQL15_00755 [Candidatus Omnitrophica bacterium]|nr:hypothetical protein [Candidatus Omnitrophota bacterium]